LPASTVPHQVISRIAKVHESALYWFPQAGPLPLFSPFLGQQKARPPYREAVRQFNDAAPNQDGAVLALGAGENCPDTR